MDGEQFVTRTIDWTNVQHQLGDFVGAAVVPNRIPFERLDHCSHKTRTSSDEHAAGSTVASLLGILLRHSCWCRRRASSTFADLRWYPTQNRSDTADGHRTHRLNLTL